MASSQIKASMKIYVLRPTGGRNEVFTSSTNKSAPRGGSPDGVTPASGPSPSDWIYLGPTSQNLGPGYKIRYIAIPQAAASADASDSIWDIPATVSDENGGSAHSASITNPATGGTGTNALKTNIAFADGALTANEENLLAEMEVKPGFMVNLGGGPLYMDLQNATA